MATEGEGLDYRHWHPAGLAACGRADRLRRLQFHDFRRTASTAPVVGGIDIKTAQTRLGHADPRTTLGVYAQATQRADTDASECLGVSFHPPVDTGILCHRPSTRDKRGMNPMTGIKNLL